MSAQLGYDVFIVEPIRERRTTPRRYSPHVVAPIDDLGLRRKRPPFSSTHHSLSIRLKTSRKWVQASGKN